MLVEVQCNGQLSYSAMHLNFQLVFSHLHDSLHTHPGPSKYNGPRNNPDQECLACWNADKLASWSNIGGPVGGYAVDTVTQRHKTHTLPNQSDMQNYPPCTNLNESQCVYELHTRLVKIAKMATA